MLLRETEIKVGVTFKFMRAAIIGCGLIGRKRAEAFPDNLTLVGSFDINVEASNLFAQEFSIKRYTSIEQLLGDSEVEVVFIATRHDQLAFLAQKAILAGKHVFIEKPGAINFKELSLIRDLSNTKKSQIHIGYNHRYHPAVRKAHEIFKSGAIGEIMFMRGRYGHGGRVGYENEWRADRSKSGGGELIDQGTHLLDLAFHFLGDINLEYGATPTYFWNMEVEDNAFVSVSNKRGNLAFLQASCTEWKNMFSLEIYGKTGKLEISGLGRSYGMETLAFHKMLPQMGPPESTIWSFPGEDESWRLEIEDFVESLRSNSKVCNNMESSLAVLKVIEEIYALAAK